MLDVLAHNLKEIATLCARFGVRRLELIGSAARGDFKPGSSDLDFLVEFDERGWKHSSDQYFGLLHGLEDLTGHRIDLVERPAVTNPLFLPVAERHCDVLYAEAVPL